MVKFLKKDIKFRWKVKRTVFYLAIVPGVTVVMLLIVFLLARRAAPPTMKEVEISPRSIVKNFFEFLEGGELDKARLLVLLRYFSSPEDSLLEANRKLRQLLTAEMEFCKNHTTKIQDEIIKGNFAQVLIEQINPADKKSFKRIIYLVREDTSWYIASTTHRPFGFPAPATPTPTNE